MLKLTRWAAKYQYRTVGSLTLRQIQNTPFALGPPTQDAATFDPAFAGANGNAPARNLFVQARSEIAEHEPAVGAKLENTAALDQFHRFDRYAQGLNQLDDRDWLGR